MKWMLGGSWQPLPWWLEEPTGALLWFKTIQHDLKPKNLSLSDRYGSEPTTLERLLSMFGTTDALLSVFCMPENNKKKATSLGVEHFQNWRSVIQYVWLSSLTAECQTSNLEVMGSTLTHCAAEYGPWQASHACVSDTNSIIWYWPQGGDSQKLGR